MKYKRPKGFPFTLAIFMQQVTDYVKLHGELPIRIELPAEEYCYLTYLRCLNENWKVLIPWDNFNGIPLVVDRHEQETEFYY